MLIATSLIVKTYHFVKIKNYFIQGTKVRFYAAMKGEDARRKQRHSYLELMRRSSQILNLLIKYNKYLQLRVELRGVEVCVKRNM